MVVLDQVLVQRRQRCEPPSVFDPGLGRVGAAPPGGGPGDRDQDRAGDQRPFGAFCGRPIPVSETGHRSHFAPMPEAEASPQEYARLIVLGFLRRAPAAAARNKDADQLALF